MRRVLLLCAAASLCGCGSAPGPGEIQGAALPEGVVGERSERQLEVAGLRERETGAPAKQILFGDLHVHSSYSTDAFMNSLPIMQGEGLHPIADACDFARYCSDLDFWSANDHAGSLNPRSWQETKQSVRQCNARAGDAGAPDLVAFLGWEWTQMGRTPQDHWGHKNVILLETAEEAVPARPIAADVQDAFGDVFDVDAWFASQLKLPFQDFAHRQRYLDALVVLWELANLERCPEGVPTRELPTDCKEVARDPAELFEKLAQWDSPSLVVPHGTTWGWYTPAGSNWDKELGPEQRGERQALIEVYSGHGNSEENRAWRGVAFDENGAAICPEPTPDYLPCCWRAGELIRERCADPESPNCEERVRDARRNQLDLGPGGHLSVSGESVEDWLDCGVCRDCFLPAFNYRPGNSAQYALAISDFGDSDVPRRFRFGFIGSSDNHSARPGTGYKEYDRLGMTESEGPRDQEWIDRLYLRGEIQPESVPRSEVEVADLETAFFAKERGGSFFMTGGLVAAHASGRDRRSIWQALTRREVYGTSGPRILLWFDLLNAPGGAPRPMGSELALAETPRFRVRASGSLVQKPGCPPHSLAALAPERLEYLCRGECYHPGDERLRIERLEIVRIRPQLRPDEPVDGLIEDPWRSFDCPADASGCVVEFEDPDFLAGGREVVYYARAIQQASPAVNGGGLRCRYDDEGRCVEVSPCYADPRTPSDDDCLADVEERAWASPIFLSPESTAAASGSDTPPPANPRS